MDGFELKQKGNLLQHSKPILSLSNIITLLVDWNLIYHDNNRWPYWIYANKKATVQAERNGNQAAIVEGIVENTNQVPKLIFKPDKGKPMFSHDL